MTSARSDGKVTTKNRIHQKNSKKNKKQTNGFFHDT